MPVDFFENGLSGYCRDVQGELKEILIFHNLTESSWKEKDSELQAEINNELKHYPENIHGEIVEGYGFDLHLNQTKFPSLHRESLLITINSFLENKINELCYLLKESNSSALSLKDLSGSGINRGLLYLSKVSNFNLSDMSPELPFIKKVSLVRNKVVHASGIMPEKPNDPVNLFVEETNGLRGGPNEKLIITSTFFEYYIEVMNAFFDKLDSKVERYMFEHENS